MNFMLSNVTFCNVICSEKFTLKVHKNENFFGSDFEAKLDSP